MVATTQTTPPVEKDAETREALARASKFYQQYEDMGRRLDSFMTAFRQLRAEVVQLLNDSTAIDHAVKQGEIKVAQAEQEAQRRLANIESGNRSLMERLTKQDIAMQNKMAEMAKRELILNQKNLELEVLKTEYERKIAGLERIAETKAAKK